MRRGLVVPTLVVLVAALVVAAGARPAAAETVAIVDTAIAGVGDDARVKFEKNLEESLRGAGFTVLGQDAVKGILLKSDATAGCSFGPCLTSVGKALGAELALVVRITADGPSFTFVLTLVDMSTGVPVAQVSDTCAVCTFDEASSAATLAIVDLGMRYGEWKDAQKPSFPAHKGKKPAIRARTWVLGGLTLVSAGAAAYLLAGRDDTDSWGFAASGAAAGLLLGTVLTF